MVQSLSVGSPLEGIPFYYSYLDQRATRKLLTKEPHGTYLLRPSSDPRAVSTISVRVHDAITNMRLFREDDFFYVETPNGVRKLFPDVNTLVDYYKGVPEIAPVDQDGRANGPKFSLGRPLILTVGGKRALDVIL